MDVPFFDVVLWPTYAHRPSHYKTPYYTIKMLMNNFRFGRQWTQHIYEQVQSYTIFGWRPKIRISYELHPIYWISVNLSFIKPVLVKSKLHAVCSCCMFHALCWLECRIPQYHILFNSIDFWLIIKHFGCVHHLNYSFATIK